MKLWEVLKELEENPMKVFECDLISEFKAVMRVIDGYFDLKILNKDGTPIPQEIKGGAFNENININRNWQEVKQPVTWQEAIEAWANGKKIKYENEHGCLTYSGNTLKDEIGPLASYQLTTGTWYIED